MRSHGWRNEVGVADRYHRAGLVKRSGKGKLFGSGAEAFDLQKPYLENWLGFIGVTDVKRIVVAGTLEAPDAVKHSAAQAVEEAARVAAIF